MQPYFFPYIGYFSLIENTDKFILLDSVQFIRHGWIERNRILKPNESWQYINIPLEKYSQTTKIKDIKINNSTEWNAKMLSQLQHYKKKAPYFHTTMNFLKEVLLETKYESITSFNLLSLKRTCEYLEINTNIELFSEMNLSIEQVNAPDEWALNICKAIKDTNEYWNPIGGTTFFDKKKYEMNNLSLKFIDIKLEEYNQHRNTFEPGLSIIDVMMFNSKEEIKEMLNSYSLV